jgi:hypothetical protein
VACIGEMKNAYNIIIRSKKNGSCGRPRHRWDVDIKMDLKEIGQGSTESVGCSCKNSCDP